MRERNHEARGQAPLPLANGNAAAHPDRCWRSAQSSPSLRLTRREFAAGLAAAPLAAKTAASYRVGITTNTRGGWESDVWLSFREAKEVGYRWVETFISYFYRDLYDNPAELKRRMDDMGLRFVTISNSGPMEMRFENPSVRDKLVADHARLARFIRKMGCKHLKINLGPRRPEGTTQADLEEIVKTLDRAGRATADEGIKLAVHAHMWAQFENRREVDYVMGHTDAKIIGFVLDTGHVTMAGMDPVELTRTLGHRIVEFHMKDTKPETRGGAKTRLDRPDMMKDPPFFPLGHGGVDFPGMKAHLDHIGWQGFLTVELDSSPFRPPKESARISLKYIQERLGIDSTLV